MSTSEELLSAVPVEVAVHYLYEMVTDTWCNGDTCIDSIVEHDGDYDHGNSSMDDNSSRHSSITSRNKYRSGQFYRHNQLLNW